MTGIRESHDSTDLYKAQFFIDDARRQNRAVTPERYKRWLVDIVLCQFANRMRHQYGMQNFSINEFRRMHLLTGWYTEIREQWDDIKDANGIHYVKFHMTKYDGTNGKRRGISVAMHKENDSDVLSKMHFLCDNFGGFLELYAKEKILDYDTVKNFGNKMIEGIILD